MGGVGQPAGGGVGSPAWRLHDGGHTGRGEGAKDLRGEVRRRGGEGRGGDGRGGEGWKGRGGEEEGYRGERKTSSPNDDVIIKMVVRKRLATRD